MDQPEESFDQLQEQLDRRRKRGMEEIAKIVNRGQHPVYSAFDVTSTSGKSYTVHIRSLTELLNTCTCPDYATNTIGTCKHIEGVLIYLRGLGFPTDRRPPDQKPSGPPPVPPSGPWGTPK